MKPNPFIILLAILILLAACGQIRDSEDGAVTTEAIEQVIPTAETAVNRATNTAQPIPTETTVVGEVTVAENEAVEEASGTSLQPTNTAAVEPTEPVPIEVTYFTPGQGEGPYYTVNKPEDRDNDLTSLSGADSAPAGEIIEFTGKVYDSNGIPISGVVVEIWQTDNFGVYLHPNDPDTDQRDRNFQFYGEAVTATDGSYGFRTILPGHYEPRPRHIHLKVKYEGQELLTTQFYFEGDPELAEEAMFNQTEGDGAHLIIGLAAGQDAKGNPILIGQRDIILNVDLSS